ncbi:MAG: twin-arginine translocase TatA/TatE family subunit [Ilumatobacteraceae bacterium]
MFAFLDSPVEIGILVLVVLLLFGGSQLPKLAKNLGQAQKEFKDGLAAGQKEDEATPAAPAAAAPPAPAVTPPTTVTDAERAEELRRLEARMTELKGEQPRSTEALSL